MLEKGLSARSAATVAAGNTAAAMGSGDLAVFATPAMVALMENAAMTAVASGTARRLDHRRRRDERHAHQTVGTGG